MGYNTHITDWPRLDVPGPVKQLIDDLFATMDLNEPQAGDILATKIFASNGVVDGSHKALGTEAIRRCRDKAWIDIESRRHEVLKVYVSDEEANDLLTIGRITVGYANGEKRTGEFIARIQVDQPQTMSPRVQLYKVWMDKAAMQKVG